jgi:hypothetical protein
MNAGRKAAALSSFHSVTLGMRFSLNFLSPASELTLPLLPLP